MKTFLGTVAGLALLPTAGFALGLDRSGQDIGILFEDGNKVELTFARVMPDLTGEDLAITDPAGNVLLPGGSRSGNVAEDFTTGSLALKYQFDERTSFAVILDEPYGSDVVYPELSGPGEGSLTLGGTSAVVNSRAVTALTRYEFNDAFSIHGGLRYVELGADVTLRGFGYGQLNGYRAQFEDDGDLGYVIGAAYERPEIALRVALSYFSKTTHDLSTTETINGVPVAPVSNTEVEAPQAVNLDFQTGIAADTLLFGSVRYAWYEDTQVEPLAFNAATNDSLTDIEDNYGLTLGVGRKFTGQLSGSFSLGFEKSRDNLVSPLAPTNGSRSVALGLSYDVNETFNVSGGVRYTRFYDARPETGTPDVARADFRDNDAVSVGMSFGISF